MPPASPLLGIKPASWACAQSGTTLNQLNHTSQLWSFGNSSSLFWASGKKRKKRAWYDVRTRSRVSGFVLIWPSCPGSVPVYALSSLEATLDDWQFLWLQVLESTVTVCSTGFGRIPFLFLSGSIHRSAVCAESAELTVKVMRFLQLHKMSVKWLASPGAQPRVESSLLF